MSLYYTKRSLWSVSGGEGILFGIGRIRQGRKDGKKRVLQYQTKYWDGDWAASRMKDKVEQCFLSFQRIAVKYDKW